LLHVNSRRWAAKALSVGESLGLRVLYPFIWRDVLAVQGRVPWSAKIRDGVVKWPLKRLLERHMPESFIYRRKSGFVPPFARWLTRADFNGRVRDVLFDRDAVVPRIVPPRVLDGLLSDALRGRELRHCILNFLWGALFTEMWIAEHGR
jgi:asparagine synthase (glutamine-hydrolysing)